MPRSHRHVTCYLPPMGYELVEVSTQDDWRDYHAIRRAVLWEARGLNGYNDRHADEYAPAHHPLLLTWAGRPIGTIRLDELGDGSAAVRLVAVAIGHQGLGHGRALMGQVERFAARIGVRTLLVNAAPNAAAFYRRIGWHEFAWDMPGLVGLTSDCTQMRKQISPRSS